VAFTLQYIHTCINFYFILLYPFWTRAWLVDPPGIYTFISM
jgi:hypothetical protein